MSHFLQFIMIHLHMVFTDQTSSNPGFTDGGQIHYDHTNDVMNLRTSGTDAITIDSSQNVGIGTTSPAQLLDVDGTARFGTSTYRITLDGKSGGGYFKIGTTSNDDSLANFGAFSSSFVLDTTQVNGFVFKHNGAEKMRLNSSGNLGIGTTSPAEDLHIKDNGDVSIALENQSDTSGNYWKLWQDNWDGSTTFTFNIDYGTTNVIKAKTTGDVTVPTGNLGIGTTSPTEKLDINSDGIRVRTAQTPASASAAGDQGQICWDANYVYVCVATNTWKRAALSTW